MRADDGNCLLVCHFDRRPARRSLGEGNRLQFLLVIRRIPTRTLPIEYAAKDVQLFRPEHHVIATHDLLWANTHGYPANVLALPIGTATSSGQAQATPFRRRDVSKLRTLAHRHLQLTEERQLGVSVCFASMCCPASPG
jgi:hypothetical protein